MFTGTEVRIFRRYEGGMQHGLMGKIRDERRDCRTVAGTGHQRGNGNCCFGCAIFCNQMGGQKRNHGSGVNTYEKH